MDKKESYSKIPGENMIKFIISPWKNEFINAISQVQKELIISSPFINIQGVEVISNVIPNSDNVELSLITNLTIGNIRNRGVDPSALLGLWDRFKTVDISSLGRLHAKVYLIDNSKAIITSANLTGGGLVSNFEYGVLIENENYVGDIRDDMKKYFSLGNVLSVDILENIANESIKIWKLKDEIDKEILKTKLIHNYEEATEKLETELLRNRIKEGKSINSIFADTILYLLERKGPLTTEELHPLIQAIHPDICDDTLDRVINGQHFGKKWKHLVRRAQEFLKIKGLIGLRDNKWRLIEDNR